MKTIFILCSLFIFFVLPAEFQCESIYGQIEPTVLSHSNDSLDEDVIIFNENNKIIITGKQAEYIRFSITKKVKYKVLSEKGISEMSDFTLPESFDQSYITHYPEKRNYTNVLSELKPNYFKVTITTIDGNHKEAIIKEDVAHIKMVMVEKGYYGNYEKYNYSIVNLAIGDTILVEYNYEAEYLDNFAKLSSFRVFFHNDMYKDNYQLSLSHHVDLNIDMEYVNFAKPDSVIEDDNVKYYYWKKNSLPACMDEKGSRPYLSLPHIVFSLKPYELLYQIPYSFEEKFIPFYSIISYMREKNHWSIAKSVSVGNTSKQYLLIDKFIRNETNDILEDSLGYLKLMKINTTIVDQFKFDDDEAYFRREDVRDPRIGEYLSKGTLRDINRYGTYVALLLKLNLDYFTTYVCDKRMGLISNNYFAPMYDSDYIFSILLRNGSVQYLYPKKSDFGYYLNEIPFYFENTQARLVHMSDYSSYKNPIRENLRQVTLPNSSVKENKRRSSVMVNINIETLSSAFKARVNLMGQYSTLTRGLYQANFKDETVNDLYNKKIWELNDKVVVLKEGMENSTKEFPFSAVVNTDYEYNNLIREEGGVFSLNLENWFNHIIYNDFNTKDRDLDFYSDFLGSDTYVYYIEFDKDVRVTKSFNEVDISNDFGELTIKMEQVKANTVKISSYFSVTKIHIPVDEIHFVDDIYTEIQRLNSATIQFELAE